MKLIDNIIKQPKTEKILANESWTPDMTSEVMLKPMLF